MKVYLKPPQESRGLGRIADALYNNAPEWATPVDHQDEADLIVIYAIGRRDALQRQIQTILDNAKRYAIIQVCLRSTMAPDTLRWRGLWSEAAVVWSYYDLPRAIAEDGYGPIDFNFYHAPLGADAEVFAPAYSDLRASKFIIATSGQSRLSESVRECWLAAETVGRDVVHLGPLKPARHVTPITNVPDEQLAVYYSNCEFVSGLRRTEGFELPAVEGLLCGARPIVFDTPDYHWNYGNHAEYIREGTRAEVVEQLVELFKRGARPVTAEEREQAVERFNWETIVGGFYERLL